MEQRPLLALNEASESGMDIIIKEGLANGRALRHPKLREWAQKLDCEVDQIALACILAQPFKARVLSGAITPEQLSSNLEAMEIVETIKDTDLKQIMDSCIMSSEEYWNERSALVWN
uniref:NADP-dependent oxidoreductase domain-containing protein n=1 Tax=Attheya septentrionalis TaxID=420275 RepID=A0A7S2UGN2_9STRA